MAQSFSETLSGDLTLQSNINSRLGRSPTLFPTTGAVNESGGAVNAGSLLVSAAGSSVLGGANNVLLLAAQINGPGSFTFANTGNLTIDTVDGIPGIFHGRQRRH